MKICYFTSTFLPKIGGAEFAVHYLAKNLSALNLYVTVLCPIPHKNSYLTNYKIQKIWVPPYSNSLLKNNYSFLEWTYLVNLVFQNLNTKFDIIHSHFIYPCGFVSVKAQKLLKTPIVCTPHGGDIQILPGINYGLRLNPRVNSKIIDTIKKIDVFISISPSIKNELIKYGAEENKIFEIPNGVDTQKFVHTPKINIKKKYHIEESKKIILSVGRNHPKKGYKNFLKVVPDIVKANNKFIYVIIGRDSTKLLPLINALSIRDNVMVIERVSDLELINFYRNASIFLSPSLIEGFALVYLEALAAGLPIIATQNPGMIDVVMDEKNGFTVPLDNYFKFIEPILDLLTDDNQLKLMGAESRKISERYDWKKIAEKHLHVYRELVY